MFGDYYTNTLVSGSPTTTMVGNEIEFYLLGGTQRAVGASLVLILSALLLRAHGLLPRHDQPGQQGGPMSIPGIPTATEVGREQLPDGRAPRGTRVDPAGCAGPGDGRGSSPV